MLKKLALLIAIATLADGAINDWKITSTIADQFWTGEEMVERQAEAVTSEY